MLARHALSSSTVNIPGYVVRTVHATMLVLDAHICLLVKVGAITLNSYHEYFPLPYHYRNTIHILVQHLNAIFEQPPGITS